MVSLPILDTVFLAGFEAIFGPSIVSWEPRGNELSEHYSFNVRENLHWKTSICCFMCCQKVKKHQDIPVATQSMMEQTLVYNALYDGLVQHDDFKFDIQKEYIQTLSGEKEAFLGAIAANYLTGLIDVRLGMVDMVGEETEGSGLWIGYGHIIFCRRKRPGCFDSRGHQ